MKKKTGLLPLGVVVVVLLNAVVLHAETLEQFALKEVESTNLLSKCLLPYYGWGVTKDLRKALDCFQGESKDSNYPVVAQVAIMTALGEATPQDPKKAIEIAGTDTALSDNEKDDLIAEIKKVQADPHHQFTLCDIRSSTVGMQACSALGKARKAIEKHKKH